MKIPAFFFSPRSKESKDSEGVASGVGLCLFCLLCYFAEKEAQPFALTKQRALKEFKALILFA
jgi:hypothetical protein